jgi:hypothetical protein
MGQTDAQTVDQNFRRPSSQANYVIRLIAVLTPPTLLGWAAWQLRRKYGVQNREQTHSTC